MESDIVADVAWHNLSPARSDLGSASSTHTGIPAFLCGSPLAPDTVITCGFLSPGSGANFPRLCALLWQAGPVHLHLAAASAAGVPGSSLGPFENLKLGWVSTLYTSAPQDISVGKDGKACQPESNPWNSRLKERAESCKVSSGLHVCAVSLPHKINNTKIRL